MENHNLHTVGLTVEEIDTPALLLDLDAMERNLAAMASFFASKKATLRPHTKTHKAPILAHRQIAAGARGICCQKLGEAEIMAQGGITDILITNEIVGRQKVRRLMHLARQLRHGRLAVCVDHPANVNELSEAVQAAGVRLDVLVDVNVGQNRCGVAPGKPALELARQVLRSPGLRLRGLQGYEGHCMVKEDEQERRHAFEAAWSLLLETKHLLKREGIDLEEISAGGTGTFEWLVECPEATEVQAGSYIVMDAKYRKVIGETRFACALSVLSTIMSTPDADYAVCDAGFKTITHDQGMPEVKGVAGIEYYLGGDEHGRLRYVDAARRFELGEKIELIVSHCDTTINLYDKYFGVRNGVVEVVWDIAGRGKSQ
ncbi:MAG: DSD1 family PLP-dependent enzyme [Candidatus Tectomicrobia bacterium]|nr:DSD1 family PLP-dependent enzyme [Candidatus Tectomicrobia bacterium]